jgi:hypothetical protein
MERPVGTALELVHSDLNLRNPPDRLKRLQQGRQSPVGSAMYGQPNRNGIGVSSFVLVLLTVHLDTCAQ